MISPKQCLNKAQECARLTRYAESPQMRVALSNFERTWLRLADQCRRVEELVESVDGPPTAPTMDNTARDSVPLELEPSHLKHQDDIAARLTADLAAEVRRRVAAPDSHTSAARDVFEHYPWPEASR